MTANTKPVVHYVKDSVTFLDLGQSALCIAIDHPSFEPFTDVQTSAVVAIHEDGFETANTRYVAKVVEIKDMLPEGIQITAKIELTQGELQSLTARNADYLTRLIEARQNFKAAEKEAWEHCIPDSEDLKSKVSFEALNHFRDVSRHLREEYLRMSKIQSKLKAMRAQS